MAIGKPSPALLRLPRTPRSADRTSLPESMATLTARAQLAGSPGSLLGLVTPPQPFAEAERKASPNGQSIIRFPANSTAETRIFTAPSPDQGFGVSSRKR